MNVMSKFGSSSSKCQSRKNKLLNTVRFNVFFYSKQEEKKGGERFGFQNPFIEPLEDLLYNNNNHSQNQKNKYPHSEINN